MNFTLNIETLKKTFVFEKKETMQSFTVDYEVDMNQKQVNIENLLSLYCSQEQHDVFIYDPHQNKFIAIKDIAGKRGIIPITFFEPQIILIRYSILKAIQKSNFHLLSHNIHLKQLGLRKMRVKERKIIQVIQMIKIWRHLYTNNVKTSSHRLNLQQCSKLVGISKKSLDDYYCQLRLGEFYQFNFADNLHQKMGVLCKFINRWRTQKNQHRKNLKYPKKLKIIEYFDLQNRTLCVPVHLRHDRFDGENNWSSDQLAQEYFEEIPSYQPFLIKTVSSQGDFFNGFFQDCSQKNQNLIDANQNISQCYDLWVQDSKLVFNL